MCAHKKPTVGRPRKTSDQQILITARQCFLERGIGISVGDIAKELGTSHTTLFNRFGSKEALMMAALGPAPALERIEALDAGPDSRPILTQLIEHAQAIALFFSDMQHAHGLLTAAGIDTAQLCAPKDGAQPIAEQLFNALVSWLHCAQDSGQIADCDLESVASMILGSLHGYRFTKNMHHPKQSPINSDEYVRRCITALWQGIGA